LQAVLDQHPTGTVYVAWDNASTHEHDDVEAVVRGAAGRLVLLYLPTYSPWLNPIEMLWRHFRREATHGELFETMTALVTATYDFFARYNQTPERVLSIIGAQSTQLLWLYLGRHPGLVAGRQDDAGGPPASDRAMNRTNGSHTDSPCKIRVICWIKWVRSMGLPIKPPKPSRRARATVSGMQWVVIATTRGGVSPCSSLKKLWSDGR
jgi:hypothetical protein